MILFKNVLRSIRKKPLQLIGISLIVMLASIMYVSFTYALVGIEDIFNKYIEESNLEDFSFTMNPFITEEELKDVIEENGLDQNEDIPFELAGLEALGVDTGEIIDERIFSLENEFEISLEKRKYKQFYFNDMSEEKDILIRIMVDMEKMNYTHIQEGVKPANNNEIAISRTFAKAYNLEIGDTFTLKDKDYEIVGFVIFPDYMYPQLSEGSLLFDPSTQTFALMTEEEFNNVNEYESSYFAGRFNKDSYTTEDIQNLDHKYMINVVDAKVQFRTGAIFSEIEGNRQMTVAFVGVLIVLSVVVVGLIVNKSIQNESTQIGVIKSLGYRNYEIGFAYLLYPLFAGVIGTGLGYIIGYFSGEPMFQLYHTFYNLPLGRGQGTSKLVFGGIVIPLALLILFSTIVIMLIIRKKPLDLIHSKRNEKIGRISQLLNKTLKRFNFKTRFKYSIAFRSLGKVFVTFVGVLIASMYLVFSLMGATAFDKMLDSGFKDAKYNYEVTYTQFIKDSTDTDEELFTQVPVKIVEVNGKEVNNESIMIGMDSTSELNKIKDNEDNDITNLLVDNGAVISKFLALQLKVQIGDTISFKTMAGDIKHLVVKGISDNYTANNIYASRIKVNSYFDLDGEYYNGKWTVNNPEDSHFIMSKFSKSELVEGLESMMQIAESFIYVMVIISAVIALIVLVIMGDYTVEDNFKSISILKVIGYKDKEISSMVINIYTPLIIITYLLSIPLTIFSFNILMNSIMKELNFAFPLNMSIVEVIIGLAIVLLVYFCSLLLSRRHLNKISLQEALKYED